MKFTFEYEVSDEDIQKFGYAVREHAAATKVLKALMDKDPSDVTVAQLREAERRVKATEDAYDERWSSITAKRTVLADRFRREFSKRISVAANVENQWNDAT